ncbi:MAG: glycerol kinase GlpK [bacterium]|nr:glycerol kinase GlpK [Acidimicrobiia bacterium]MCY4651171.1 glycerol kinase GlpK [bacterium]
MNRQAVGAIDQGTTSTRFMIFDQAGRVVSMAQREFRQILPRPGWVEHDPVEILDTVESVVGEALASAGMTVGDLAAVGIANQRETTLVWDHTSGRPLANAIVWQDTRTDGICENLAREGGIDRFRDRTGLPLATYFSGPKTAWLLDNIDGAAEKAVSGQALMGTIDSWLVWNLTGGIGGGRHVTDVTNASRTLLMDLDTLDWSDDLLDAVGIPRSMMAQILPSVGWVGTGTGVLDGVPISAILGDQQAALFGQTCFRPGEAKNTYGTGCFLLMNTGTRKVHSDHGLLTTVGYQIAGSDPVYALEGSVAVTGSLVQWLRDNLGMISTASEVEELAASVPDNGDVYFVPAFSGLFAPHWRTDARGVITGLTRFATKGHIARAALEATAYQTREVLEAMRADSEVALAELRVDGGMVANDLLMQFQSDILDVEVVCPQVSETTALGAAYGAGLAEGFWAHLDDLRHNWQEAHRWSPQMSEEARDAQYARWQKAVSRSLNWVGDVTPA